MTPRNAPSALADEAMPRAEDERALEAFDYPREWARIADRPAPVRDEARLLVYDRRTGLVAHRRFRDLPEYCAAGDAVAVNESRVIPARLDGVKAPSGGRVEVLLVRRLGDGVWSAWVRGAVRPGQRLAFGEGGEGEVLEPDAEGRHRLRLVPDDPAWLERVGRVPLPPYLRRERGDPSSEWKLPAASCGESSKCKEAKKHDFHVARLPHSTLRGKRSQCTFVDDRERYQTVFAKTDGSVAAPTAGLHFTPAVLGRLADGGVETIAVTLHVGPGTFEPVRTSVVDAHRMAAEWGEVTPDAAERLGAVRARGGRVIAVGTTSTRVLETAASDDGRVGPWRGDTALFIRPGYRWKAVGALLTNFHLPRSTPLLLAAAFCGRSVLLELYREAAREGYRFYSYGDAMLIL